MDDFLQTSRNTSVAGIAADHWIKFFRIYAEPVDHAEIDKWLERRMKRASSKLTGEVGRQVIQLLRELGRLLNAG